MLMNHFYIQKILLINLIFYVFKDQLMQTNQINQINYLK